MGEIFRREAAEHPEPFTGERFTGTMSGQIQIEHYHRYLFARALVGKLDVLDVASGEGYGSALLAQVARSVIGVEYAADTVRNALRSFPRPNVRFLQGDARSLPLATASMDAVVSFETIEHFDRQDDFLREVRRVLRPGGSFIVSTPDRDVYSPATEPANPFHVFELTRTEFLALLHQHFAHVRLMHQRVLTGSALLAETASVAPPLVFDRRGNTHFEACIGLPRAPYLIAVASDREPNALPPSIYINHSDIDADTARIWELTRELRQVRSDAATACAERDQTIAALQAAEKRARIHAEQEARIRTATEEQLQALLAQHEQLRGSARTFLRGYLPLLRRHLLGQRP